MNLNYSIADTIKLLGNSFKYNMFIAIIISVLIFTFLIFKNKDKKVLKYVISILNTILVIVINIYYFKGIISFEYSNPINNIYFYFFNTCLYLIIFAIYVCKKGFKKLYIVLYSLSLINILFSIFMTHYLNNITLVTIGNIYPMIKFGNIIYFVFYAFLTKEVIDVIIKSSFKGVK